MRPIRYRRFSRNWDCYPQGRSQDLAGVRAADRRGSDLEPGTRPGLGAPVRGGSTIPLRESRRDGRMDEADGRLTQDRR